MSEEVFEKRHAKTMSAILLWAYEHHIEVRFSRRYSHGGDSYPVIKFSRNDKHVEHVFWPHNDDEYAEHLCKDIGFKLCISAPRFLNPQGEQGES